LFLTSVVASLGHLQAGRVFIVLQHSKPSHIRLTISLAGMTVGLCGGMCAAKRFITDCMKALTKLGTGNGKAFRRIKS
jgi:hypothetical protein